MLQTVEPSQPPSWVTDSGFWRQQFEGQPLRLLVSCTRADDPPWEWILDVVIVDELQVY